MRRLMRQLKPFLPAVGVALLAVAVFLWPGSRRPLAESATPVERLTLPAGGHVELAWPLRALRRPDRIGACPTIFLHLRDPDGAIVRQFDHQTTDWIAMDASEGEPIVDRSTLGQSLLDAPLSAGTYRLEGGLWDPETRRRFRLRDADGRVERRVVVAEVEVIERPASAPQVELVGGWTPIEPADTVHGRTRRGWVRPATVVVRGHAEPTELRLVIDLPPWASPRGTGAGVVVECTGETLALAERWQEIRVRLPPDRGDGCAVRLPAIDTSGDTGGLVYSVTTAEATAMHPGRVRPL